VEVERVLDRRSEGAGLAELDDIVRGLLDKARAPSTVRTYDRWMLEFRSFVQATNEEETPVAQQLARFAAKLFNEGRGGIVRVAACAVAFEEVKAGRGSPLTDGRLRLVLDAIEREWAAATVRRVRDPFPIDALRVWVCTQERQWTATTIRDAAVVALGLRAMRRAGELAAIMWEDITWEGDSNMRLRIRRSKTDQLGQGHDVFIEGSHSPQCPVRLLRLLQAHTGLQRGRVFQSVTGAALTASAISSICKRMVAAAGLSARVSSHSLRIGGATAAMEGGLSKEQVMVIGGWQSNAVERYLRAREAAIEGTTVRMGL
jgi:integrase